MNKLLRLVFILFLMLSGANIRAQTQKKPVKKPVTAQKTEQQKRIEAKAAARAKAKADSVAAVHALARKLAREMFVADSIKRVQEEETRMAALKKHAELLEQQELARKLAAETAASTKSRGSGGGRFGIGLKGLGNTAFTQSINGNTFSPAIGYGLGLVAALRFSERRALVVEILYNQYNYKVDYFGAPYTMYENTLQVPLLFRWHMKGKNKRFFINSGPFGEYVSEQWNSINGLADDPTSFALGLAAGGGAEFMIGRGWLSIEARGNFQSNQIAPALSCGYTIFF